MSPKHCWVYEVRKMSQHESKYATSASQIWGILILAAKYEQTIGYKELAVLVNNHWRKELSLSLDPIKEYCENRNLPVLTVLVVEKGTQKPSTGLDDIVKDFDEEKKKVFDWAKEHWEDFEGGALKNPGIEAFENP